MKRIGIIGAGRFGRSLVESLAEYGVEILLIDEKRDVVQDFSQFVTKAIEGDVTNIRTLMEAGFKECDVAIVGIGSNLEGSILATVNCKDLGIPKVIAKANSDLHGKILKRVGADTIVYPNRDCAKRLCHVLLSKGGIDLFEISDGFSIAEIDVPEPLRNKSLAEASVRNTYGVTVLCVRRLADDPEQPRTVIIPTPTEVIQPDDKLLIFGAKKKIDTILTEA
ncbi:MAG: TrkA family potassium uptake protein [Kiritimatiellaeota bacterium]|nr:TrkA family potassium uptake protein [Kiritimatiellota bacterium]